MFPHHSPPMIRISAKLLKKNSFWMVSRVAVWCYARVPVFGRLRASIGVIRKANRVLMIRRNDGRGFSFPGGLALPWETDERALVREIKEETGLLCDGFEFAFRYESRFKIPVVTTVFHVRTAGEIRGSWEGDPEWVTIVELQNQILRSQQQVVERLLAESKNTVSD